MLWREIKIMEEMKNHRGFPKIISCGKNDHYNYIVMTLLGRNLDTLLKKCGGKFSLPTVVHMAKEMVHLLERLHRKKLVRKNKYIFKYIN